MIRIVVDDRERAGGLAQAIGRVMGRRPEVARLEVGDVAIGDRFVVERKEAADWVVSLRDGRLARQLGRLKGVQGAILIVEGEFSPRILRGLDPRRVRQAMLEVSLDWRIPLLHSRDVADTAHWIGALAERLGGGASEIGLALESRVKPAAPPLGLIRASDPSASRKIENVQLAALERIQSLGRRKAALLLEHFGSVSAIARADEEQLTSVRGIGPTLARKIFEILASG